MKCLIFFVAFSVRRKGFRKARKSGDVVSASFLFIVVASDEESVYRKNIFASTARVKLRTSHFTI